MLALVSRAIDAFAVVLMLAAAAAFSTGVYAIGDRQDLRALYLLLLGGLALHAGTEILRPRSGG
jgi:hypothetical protein